MNLPYKPWKLAKTSKNILNFTKKYDIFNKDLLIYLNVNGGKYEIIY